MKSTMRFVDGQIHARIAGGLVTFVAWRNQKAIGRGKSRGFWVRLNGKRGMCVEWRARDYLPLFSERNGQRKVIKLGRIAIEAL